jgi:2-methylcitrate dehydratase PrpD
MLAVTVNGMGIVSLKTATHSVAATGVGPTRTLASHIAAMGFSDLDDQTVHRAKYHTLDTIGAILAGAGQDVTKIAGRALERAGCGGNVPVAGQHIRTDMLSAAFLSGAAGHGLELDDGYRAGSVHPGTVIIPAALVAAYKLGCSGDALIKAVVAGYEVMCRLSAACHPRARWRGFHNTSTTGVFGAATVWGTLQGFDVDRLEHAFGAAASTASGLFTFLYGGDVKRLHPGIAAKNGLLAGLLAQEGLQGPPNVLESKEGFFYAYAGGDQNEFDYDSLDILSVGGGSPWAINDCYIKPYACCRHIHSVIDAIFDIMDETNLAAEQVQAVHVGSYKVATSHDLRQWENFTTAQMSIPFVVATALRYRAVDLDHFTANHRSDENSIALARKVTVGVDEGCENDYPRTRSAVVAITTIDGQSVERRVDEPYGSPANRLDDEALTAKFKRLASGVIGADQADRVADEIWALESNTDVRPLIAALSPACVPQ